MDEMIHVNHRGIDVFLSTADDCCPKERIWIIAKNATVPFIEHYSKALNTKETYHVTYDPNLERIIASLC